MLSAGQWTSRNLVNNCVGKLGPIGPIGPTGPVGPPGDKGVDGIDGTGGVNGLDGSPGEPGEPGITGPEGLLPFQLIDTVNTRNFTLSLEHKYTTFVLYLDRPITNTNNFFLITITPSTSLQSYTRNDFWVKIVCQNISAANNDPLIIQLITNNETTYFRDIYSNYYEHAMVCQTAYLYWNGSSLVLY